MRLFSAFVICFFLLAARAMAMNVFYDTTTLNVAAAGLNDPKTYTQEHPNLASVYVKDEAAVLKLPITSMRYDAATKTIISQVAAEIQKTTVTSRMKEISSQIDSLLLSKLIKSLKAAEGFDVSKEVGAIQAQIDTLKAEYNSIK